MRPQQAEHQPVVDLDVAGRPPLSFPVVSSVTGLIETDDSLCVRTLEPSGATLNRVEYRFPVGTTWRVLSIEERNNTDVDAHCSTFEIDTLSVLLVDASSPEPVQLDDLVVITPTDPFLAALDSNRVSAGHAAALTRSGVMRDVSDGQIALADDVASMLDDAGSAWPLVEITVRMDDRTLHANLCGGATTSIEIVHNGFGGTRLARFQSAEFLLRLLDVTGLSATPLRPEVVTLPDGSAQGSTGHDILSMTTCTIVALSADGSLGGGMLAWVETPGGNVAEVELDDHLNPTGQLVATDVDRLTAELLSFLPDGFT